MRHILLFIPLILSQAGWSERPPTYPATAEVAQNTGVRKLKSAIYPGIEPGFDYNLLFENTHAIGTTSVRTVVLESLNASVPDALTRLDANLQAKGFKKNHQQDVKGSLIRNYLNKAGDSISVQAKAYPKGAKGKAPGGTGSMTLNIRRKG